MDLSLKPGATGGESVEFSVPEGAKVMGLHIETQVDNGWVYVDAELLDADSDALIGATGEEVGYYHGYEGGESWTEGSRSKSRYFKAPPPGDYVLAVEVEGDQAVPIQVSLTHGDRLARYPLILAGLLVLGPVLIGLRWRAFERDRWDEEDDD